jgi:hypothetical protein
MESTLQKPAIRVVGVRGGLGEECSFAHLTAPLG